MTTLDTTLRTIIARAATNLAKREIITVRDLLEFWPRRYLDPTRPTDFSSLQIGEYVVVLAFVKTAVTRKMKTRRGSMLIATIEDGDGHELELTFFSAWGHQDALVPGRLVLAAGTISYYEDSRGGRMQLTHPEYEAVKRGGHTPGAFDEGPIPVYAPVPGMNSMKVARAVDLVLHALEPVPDPIPVGVRAKHGLPPLDRAYAMLHQPRSVQDERKGRWRMKFQEAFVLQAALARLRHSSNAVPAVPRTPVTGGVAEQFRERLPFQLTDGQEQVLTEIRQDLQRTVPMNRLLQGEVGSGKTVVALLAMLTVIDAGGQAALLAPTEVLAAQHQRSITALLGPLAEAGLLGGAADGTRIAFLTGSQSAAERRANLLMAASGEAGIVVGTHALIQDHVQFAELGLVVVDEQHRFGVEQRDALRTKADGHTPHTLVMTATPIPRTVAMTVFGDMETSTLSEVPSGRQPITTHVVRGHQPNWVERTWSRVAEEVSRGGQVYVVCPRIGQPDDPDLPEGTTIGPGGPIMRRQEGGGPAPGTSTGDTTSTSASPRSTFPSSTPGGDDLFDDETLTWEADADEEEKSGRAELHGVLQVQRALRELPATADLRIGILHGRQSPEEKDAVMQSFSSGEIDVLVATTVIEVGVDVPNATQMVVIDADRFGISQLHQLRGRIGRGSKPGLCLLMCQSAESLSLERLDAVAATTDGFQLARLDLAQRREGDVLGASQSGRRSGIRLLRLSRDEDLIVTAHEDAWQIVGQDPDLEGHPELRAELDRMDAERAAFLERG
ncbi:ATP-dependent DNA helicase RecG [Ornithinimicrobium cryptoxanthini]|uniref:Probable DNA 3'-5' helicase RecG n=1 Tax=Ornithinimicrobium cryptoxanthini TaxID=2934161 RepID=A0ABY4YF39_9MICO|nr:ATP-dependent DNA helicase RecG [Ornithinimicrobium cryptoxanthini]USQ75214.1 ATP-dependent DNA helicase RecG [Ornithinimicrobium cryptoxanthini]